MKKYLMTWYGITDIRASIQFGEITGPVLGALLAEDYTDVVILGFTNSSKKGADFHKDMRKIDCSNLLEVGGFIDSFSNTEESHEYFYQWLEEQLKHANKNTRIHFKQVNLQHLNDIEGIYEADILALDTVSAKKGEKLVTLYLSPGTSLMASAWSFAALKYPDLKKRMIASPCANSPPENVSLPSEWLEWHGKQVMTTSDCPEQYDVIFHLFGEQRMPALFGITHFSSKKHVFVNSEQFPADVMRQFIDDEQFDEISVSPFDPENVRSVIVKHIESFPSNARIGFNLTGGTKLMYAGAFSACKKVNATPFYFNSHANKVIYLNDFQSSDIKSIYSVEDFIKLNGGNLPIANTGHWGEIHNIDDPERGKLTQLLWNKRSLIVQLYGDKKLNKFNDKEGVDFKLSGKNISVELKNGRKATIKITENNGKEYSFSFLHWNNFARYLSGGWFEEYVYAGLQPLLDSKKIKDMRIGFEISANKGAKSNQENQGIYIAGSIYQEFDIVLTDGKRLYVIECKSGRRSKGEFVEKLSSITRQFGGVEGRGIVASCFAPEKVPKEKALQSSNVEWVFGEGLVDKIEAIICES